MVSKYRDWVNIRLNGLVIIFNNNADYDSKYAVKTIKFILHSNW